ncbi:hypothetical protein ACFGVR_23470 [Mucilaginibacter sp. AW1-3]
MSDKELDQLFNAELTDLEVAPSAELWGKIVPEIPGSSKTRSGLAPMLSIAATLVILLTAGLLFMPRTQKLALHGNHDPQQTITEAVAAVTEQPQDTEEVPDITGEQPVTEQPQTAVAVKSAKTDYAINKGKQGTPEIVNPIDSMPALTLIKPVNIGKPDKQDNNNNLIKPVTPVTNSIAVNVAPKTDPLATKTTETVKKKKIHSLGDLLNVVIAKVDKRDNKIIQFGSGGDDDDDDLLNVTGVNLGPIKVKKQN